MEFITTTTIKKVEPKKGYIYPTITLPQMQKNLIGKQVAAYILGDMLVVAPLQGNSNKGFKPSELNIEALIKIENAIEQIFPLKTEKAFEKPPRNDGKTDPRRPLHGGGRRFESGRAHPDLKRLF